MAAGGLLAVADRRYRVAAAVRKARAALPPLAADGQGAA
ncbi:MAG: hypothetical protein GAK38_00174 [Xylophilus sp.]|nr:MAG: hypothetical protein GAK38_00174 [Xylophilus sp.]